MSNGLCLKIYSYLIYFYQRFFFWNLVVTKPKFKSYKKNDQKNKLNKICGKMSQKCNRYSLGLGKVPLTERRLSLIHI